MPEEQSTNPTDISDKGEIIDVKTSANSFIPTVEAAGEEPVEQTQPQSQEQQAVQAAPVDASQPPSADKPIESVDTDESKKPEQQPIHKPKKPIGVIIAAVVVASLLAAVSIFAFMQQQDEEDTATSTSNNTTQQTDTTPAEVDQTTAEVDKALEAAENTDFPESELTDNNLGI
jgi:uncharacterized protein HemX